MPAVLTAIVSDLHLGVRSGADVARGEAVHARLAEALARADRIVLLGDVLELRELPVSHVLEAAEPALRAIGAAASGKEVILVPGNHDHELIGPALDRARRNGTATLEVAGSFAPASADLAGNVAALMPQARLSLSYPGAWLRDDVWATHGHYLDMHLTVPRPECVLGSAFARFAGERRIAARGAPLTPDAYEAALTPIYALAGRLAQSRSPRAATGGGGLSRDVWAAARGRGPSWLVARGGIAAAVRAVNAAGLGPFRDDITPVELRRSGLRSMGEVARRLGVEARHVIFGHTHRAGPLPADVEGWWLPGGTQLTNTGSWLYEGVFVGDSGGPENPYWPGRITWLGDEGPPWMETLFEGPRTPPPTPPRRT